MAVHHYQRVFDEKAKKWVLRCNRCGDVLPLGI